MKKLIIIFILGSLSFTSYSQGFNHTWLLGYFPFPDTLGRINFSSNSDTLKLESRKMQFDATQANISDGYGKYLMSSNGVWIANNVNDTMMNGTGLLNSAGIEPLTTSLQVPFAHVFVPYPGDSNRYILFHHSATWDGFSFPAYNLYYSVIDITLDSGRGAVVLKNQLILNDTMNWGIGVCKHANGRDWWIIMSKNRSSDFFKILFTPQGVSSITKQTLNLPYLWYNVTNLRFSQNGDRFCCATYDSTNAYGKLLMSDFNRCTGTFSNEKYINLGDFYLFGNTFSSSGEFVYANTNRLLFQVNYNTLSVDTVAINDTFYAPSPPFQTDFWYEYLGANGKIYLTSGNSVTAIHYINFPDSAGLACDVHQHGYSIPFFNFRTVPNHPNYYLGCDTTLGCPCLITTGIIENTQHDFKFRIYPNPVSNSTLNIGYLLPQNKAGVFQVIDITGKILFNYNLPQWSNEQSINLPDLSNGVYSCVITSNGYRVSKKLVVIRE